MVRIARFVALAAAFSLSACSAAEAEPEVRNSESQTADAKGSAENIHPVSGLRLIEVTVDDGTDEIVFTTELADTPAAQAQGLMFRAELADDEAMLFPSDPPAPRSFWMKNTPIPLDIIFVGADGRITNIAAQTVPYSLDSVPSDGIASAVLEIRGGLAAEVGIEPGDLVEYELP